MTSARSTRRLSLAHSQSCGPDPVSSTTFDRSAILAARAERDHFLAEHYASPISEEDRAGFAGADYYEPNDRFVFVGSFREVAAQVAVPSSTGTVSDYHGVGVIQITIDGHPYALTVLDDGDGGTFLAFGNPIWIIIPKPCCCASNANRCHCSVIERCCGYGCRINDFPVFLLYHIWKDFFT